MLYYTRIYSKHIFVISIVTKPFSCRNGYRLVNNICEGQHFTGDLNHTFACEQCETDNLWLL